MEFNPGKGQKIYSNSDYVVLTKIIETVSNLSYADYLKQHFFEPLAMTDSGYDRAETILPNRAAGYLFTGEVYKNVDCLAFSSDGKFLAAGGQDGKVIVWSIVPIEQGRKQEQKVKLIASLDNAPSWIDKLAWSQDGQYLSASVRDGELIVWSESRRGKGFG